MRLKYDLNVGALYIRLADLPVARTREVDDNTSIDLDAEGGVVGIEVVSITHPWAFDEVLRHYSIPDGEVAQLRAYFQPSMPGSMYEAPAVEIEPTPPVPVLS